MDLFRHSLPLCLLTILLPCTAIALIEDSTQRKVSLGTAETIRLESFYHRIDPKNQAAELSAERAWGFQMESGLPTTGIRAKLNYSMTAVSDQDHQSAPGDDSFTAKDNHLLQLSLDSQWHDIAYGMRYFSAGEQFADLDLGRNLLRQADVSAASDGTEVWARMRLATFELKPAARRVISQHGQKQVIDNQFAVSATRPILGKTRFHYQYRTSTRLTDPRGTVKSQLSQESDHSSFNLTHPRWRFAWTSQSRDDYLRDQVRSQNTQKFSASLRLLDQFVLSPMVSLSSSEKEDVLVEEVSTAALRLGYQPLLDQSPELNLTLKYRQRSGIQEHDQDLSANLGVKKRFQLPGSASNRSSVSASLSYQRRENLINGLLENNLGVLFKFEHLVGS